MLTSLANPAATVNVAWCREGLGTGLRRWRGCFIDPCIENDPGARLFSLVFRPPVGRPRSLAAQGSIGYRSGFWIVVSSQVQGGSVDGEQGGSGAEVGGNSGGCGRLGKMIAREAFPDGPERDVTLADMEEYAVAASRAVVKGAVESMTAAQGGRLGEEAPCPTCGKMCPLKRKSRPVVVRGGEAQLDEPAGYCSTCRRDFFPQRPVLKLDGHRYSPTILYRILHIASVTGVFNVAEKALKVVGEISISASKSGVMKHPPRSRQTNMASTYWRLP